MSSRTTFLALLKFLAPFKFQVALAVLLGSLTIGSSIGLMATSAYIIASAALHPSIADLAVAIVGVRFFGIARGVFRYLERLVSHHVNFSLLASLRVWLYTSIEPLAPARLMSYRSGDLLTRIVSDIETLQNFYVRIVAPPMVALVIALAVSVYLAAFSPMIALTVLGFMVLVGLVLPTLAQRLSASANCEMIQTRAGLNVQLVDGIQGIPDLLAYGGEEIQATRVNALSRKLVRLQSHMSSLAGLHNALGGLMAHLAMWCVLLIAIPMVTRLQLNGVYLSVLVLAVLASFEGVLALPLAFQYLESNLESARRLFEIAGERTEDRGQGTDISSISSLLGPRSSVSFENVSFRYNDDEPVVLDNASFDVRSGGRIAIVGSSGAGKSTIVNLLLRFWDEYDGRIAIGKNDLRDYSPEDARKFFAVVSQTTHLFNATIRENLLLARSDATEEQIVHATQQAQVHDFIVSLPQGYNTHIGEQGLNLSGGERQRLAIARALLKDAPIVILDEATANLDRVTEREVLRAIRALTEQRTTLMITHRLVGLENVDEIIVLQNGRVAERGAHAELLQVDGLYRRMWMLQNQL